jgi:hypothetical protein
MSALTALAVLFDRPLALLDQYSEIHQPPHQLRTHRQPALVTDRLDRGAGRLAVEEWEDAEHLGGEPDRVVGGVRGQDAALLVRGEPDRAGPETLRHLVRHQPPKGVLHQGLGHL